MEKKTTEKKTTVAKKTTTKKAVASTAKKPVAKKTTTSTKKTTTKKSTSAVKKTTTAKKPVAKKATTTTKKTTTAAKKPVAKKAPVKKTSTTTAKKTTAEKTSPTFENQKIEDIKVNNNENISMEEFEGWDIDHNAKTADLSDENMKKAAEKLGVSVADLKRRGYQKIDKNIFGKDPRLRKIREWVFKHSKYYKEEVALLDLDQLAGVIERAIPELEAKLNYRIRAAGVDIASKLSIEAINDEIKLGKRLLRSKGRYAGAMKREAKQKQKRALKGL